MNKAIFDRCDLYVACVNKPVARSFSSLVPRRLAGMLSTVAPSSILAFFLGCCLCLQQCSYASASLAWTGQPLSSRNCVQRIASTKEQRGDGCVTPVCGALNTTGDPFEEQLTPSCRAVLDKYAAKDLSLSWADSPALDETPECRTFPSSQYPTNPVVVQNKITSSFGFCSVPKAACSQIRSLLFVMTSYPDQVSWCVSAS